MPEARIVKIRPASDLIAAAPRGGLPCALAGDWVDVGRPSIMLSPRLLDPRFGFASASLEVEGRRCEAVGFIDPFADAEGCRFQAVSLSALIDAESGETITLAGSLDAEEGIFTVTVFRNAGTSNEYRYTQTRVDQFRLIRAR
jgi:hypothetical protein